MVAVIICVVVYFNGWSKWELRYARQQAGTRPAAGTMQMDSV